jgi:hypothetical protein
MPTALLLAYVLDIAAATALLFAKKDFTEKAGYAASGAA